ncbi:MAG: selenide, water dikinase SelD, partial [Chloroflexota bacterium]
PVLPEARRLAALSMVPGGSQRNLEALRGDVAFGALGDIDQQLLADAQTSGGLLIAVAQDRLAELLERLQAAGTPAQSLIGEITAAREPSIRVLAATRPS